MFAETSAQAEIQYRQQRFLDEAAAHRLARQAQQIRRAERGAREATEAGPHVDEGHVVRLVRGFARRWARARRTRVDAGPPRLAAVRPERPPGTVAVRSKLPAPTITAPTVAPPESDPDRS